MKFVLRVLTTAAIALVSASLSAATWTVTNANASGAGSLAAAIASAGGTDTIVFAIPGAGVHTITASNLSINVPLVIDATTQPGYSGAPLIEINAGANGTIFLVNASATIKGFALTNFTGEGIRISDGAGNTTIAANYIGTAPDGVTANGGINGITVSDQAGTSSDVHLIGGSTSADRNVISGNITGIWAGNATVATVSVQGNFIGTNATGSAGVPNLYGIRSDADLVPLQVGGVTANTIAFNSSAGVYVSSGSSQILGNSFFSNGIGIDNVSGNAGELPPVITSVVVGGGNTTVTGTLAAEASTPYTLQFFSNPVNENQGRTFFGQANVTTDGAGNASFTATLPSITPGLFVTATATNTLQHETSEFASSVVATLGTADLTITKTAAATSVNVGTPIDYTITVSNAGPSGASGVTVTDVLPPGTTFVSATPSQGSCSGTTTVTCSLGTIASGANATIALRIQTTTAGTVNNSASVTENETDPNGGTTASAQPVTVNPIADLTITKTPSSTSANVGGTIDYTIAVSNAGPSPATGVTVTDTLPAGTSFVSATPSQGSCSGTTTVTCSLGTIASGANATIALRVQATASGSVVNSASVTANEPDPNGGTTAAAAAVTVSPATADLTITKAPSSTTANVGGAIDYTISVTNSGPNAATNVVVTDTLPPGTVFVSATPSQGSCSGTTTVTCSLGTIANAANATIALRVQATAPGSVVNSASVSATEADPNGGTTAAAAAVTVSAVTADLTITKVPSATTASIGGAIDYTISVTNSGPNAATNVVVTDTLPPGTVFVSATPSQGSCSGTTTVTCSLGTIANAANATIALRIAATAPGSVVNSASVSATEADPNGGTTATAPAVVVGGAAGVPTLSPELLLALAVLLGAIAVSRH